MCVCACVCVCVCVIKAFCLSEGTENFLMITLGPLTKRTNSLILVLVQCHVW